MLQAKDMQINNSIREKCETLKISYNSNIIEEKLDLFMQDADFFCKVIEEEREFLDDETSSLPAIAIWQDEKDGSIVEIRIIGLSFVFTAEDYVPFIKAISHAKEVRFSKSGKEAVRISLRYDLKS